MARNKLLFNSIILMSSYLQGCCPKGPWQQEVWHDDMRRGAFAVGICEARGAPFIVDKQLVALVGEPDYKLYPEELELMMAADDSYKEHTMKRLYEAYCIIQKDRSDLNNDCKASNWRESESFKRCTLWLYDETKHFSKPLPYCSFCADEGFACKFFFLEGSSVIGAAGEHRWKSLATGVGEGKK
jgi:hypothetical protein